MTKLLTSEQRHCYLFDLRVFACTLFGSVFAWLSYSYIQAMKQPAPHESISQAEDGSCTLGGMNNLLSVDIHSHIDIKLIVCIILATLFLAAALYTFILKCPAGYRAASLCHLACDALGVYILSLPVGSMIAEALGQGIYLQGVFDILWMFFWGFCCCVLAFIFGF